MLQLTSSNNNDAADNFVNASSTEGAAHSFFPNNLSIIPTDFIHHPFAFQQLHNNNNNRCLIDEAKNTIFQQFLLQNQDSLNLLNILKQLNGGDEASENQNNGNSFSSSMSPSSGLSAEKIRDVTANQSRKGRKNRKRKFMAAKNPVTKKLLPPNNHFENHEVQGDLETQNGEIKETTADSEKFNSDTEIICEWKNNCKQAFLGLNALIEHLLTTHIRSQENYQQCHWKNCNRSRTFKFEFMLLLHIRRHLGDRPHECFYPNCKKTYTRLENLKTHVRIHTGERPYFCEVEGCHKSFTAASDRAKHQSRTHCKVKPYTCIVVSCNKSYTDPSSLRKHIKINHNEKAYKLFQESKIKGPKNGISYRIYIPSKDSIDDEMKLVSEDELKNMGIFVEKLSNKKAAPTSKAISCKIIRKITTVKSKKNSSTTKGAAKNIQQRASFYTTLEPPIFAAAPLFTNMVVVTNQVASKTTLSGSSSSDTN